MAHVAMFLALLPGNFQHFFLWVQISKSSIKVSLGSAIRSDVTNASTAETFFVGSTLPSAFSAAFAQIVLGFSENFLAVSDHQTAQFSIFTTGMVVAVFIAQISHHH